MYVATPIRTNDSLRTNDIRVARWETLDQSVVIDRPEQAGAYFKAKFAEDPLLSACVLFLDEHSKVLACELSKNEGFAKAINPLSIVKYALNNAVCAVIVGENRQVQKRGSAANSRNSVLTLKHVMDALQVHLRDYIICDGEKAISAAMVGFLD